MIPSTCPNTQQQEETDDVIPILQVRKLRPRNNEQFFFFELDEKTSGRTRVGDEVYRFQTWGSPSLLQKLVK